MWPGNVADALAECDGLSILSFLFFRFQVEMENFQFISRYQIEMVLFFFLGKIVK
jgi:hypothetical protein